jgi:regulatory protein
MPDPVTLPDQCDGESPATEAINPADVRLAAMNLLARREHSLRELHLKLRRRFGSDPPIASELQRLADENLQSDTRYAHSYCRQRAAKGFGPLRVRQEMRDKGLTDQEIVEAFKAEELDWSAIAAAAFAKKFGQRGCDDLKEKSRRARFMQYRGFSSMHYQYMLEK